MNIYIYIYIYVYVCVYIFELYIEPTYLSTPILTYVPRNFLFGFEGSGDWVWGAGSQLSRRAENQGPMAAFLF